MVHDLPSSPSLDHLRKMAKSLVTSVRAGEPDAVGRVVALLPGRAADLACAGVSFPLAYAQHVVAREYGFQDWAAMKRAVLDARLERPSRRTRADLLTELCDEVLQFARSGDLARLAYRVGHLPNRDILAVRERLTRDGTMTTLIDALLAGLRHRAAPVRYHCAGALDHLADERCAEPLRLLLDDPVPRVRRAALHSLACDACKLAPITDTGGLVPKVIAMAFDDPSVRVRRVAVETLGERCADPLADEALRRIAETTADAGIRWRIERTWGRR